MKQQQMILLNALTKVIQGRNLAKIFQIMLRKLIENVRKEEVKQSSNKVQLFHQLGMVRQHKVLIQLVEKYISHKNSKSEWSMYCEKLFGNK